MDLRRKRLAIVSCALLVLAGNRSGASGQSAQSGSLTPAPSFDSLLQDGFALHQQARFAEAIPVLERARKLDQGDYFVNLLLGIDLLRTGKPEQAVPRLKLAAHVRPEEEFPEEYLGEAEAAMHHPASAAEAYQRALTRGHNSEESLEAWAGFALERFRQIGEQLRATELGLAAARRLQKSAIEAAEHPSCGTSIPLLERRLATKPDSLDTETAYRLSVCYTVEASSVSTRLASNSEDQAAVHRLRGDVLLRLNGDAAAAESEYQKAISAHANDPALWDRLAEAQMSAGETEAARQSARAALAIDPHRPGAMRTLAALAMSDRDYVQALPWLQELLAQSPADRALQVELGRALAQTGKPAEALKYLVPAIESGYPDEKGALHALLARTYRKLGRDADAAKAEAEARRLSDAFQVSAPSRPGSDPIAPDPTSTPAPRDAMEDNPPVPHAL